MTAATATTFDFVVLTVLVELCSVYYVSAVALASSAGGILNYILNRKWAFRSDATIHGEAFRYLLVSGGSLAWNTFLVWLLTEFASLRYLVSKVIVVAFIGVLWNYPLHRYWVFSRKQTA